MVYKSAIDWWFWAVIGSTAVLLAVVSLPLMGSGQTVALTIIAASALFGLGFPVWLAFSTIYSVTRTHLIVRSGPFRWTIERASIQDIQPTRSVISSPALSLDRLEIRYGSGQSLLVSPADKQGFLDALSADA